MAYQRFFNVQYPCDFAAFDKNIPPIQIEMQKARCYVVVDEMLVSLEVIVDRNDKICEPRILEIMEARFDNLSVHLFPRLEWTCFDVLRKP